MVNLGTAMAYLELDTSRFNASLSSSMSNLNAFANSSATVGDKITALGATAAGVGKTFTTSLTLPLVGVGTAAVKSFSDFESTLKKVEAISGATADDMTRLKDRASELGASTKFSASEVAEGFTYMAMAGWKTEDMLQGIDGILNLAAADGLDLATTSDIVTDAITAFGLSAEDAGHFANVLAAAASNSNTNVSMLGESFKYTASIAGTLGYSIEDVSVALGLMANNGIKASQAGTTLRGALTRLASPPDKGNAIIWLDKLGLMVDDVNTAMFEMDGTAKPLGETLDILRDSFKGLSDEEQTAAAKAIFGQQAMSGMLAIINTSEEDYNKLRDAIDNASEGMGAASDMAETMLDNLQGSITIFKSALEGVLNSIGEIITPIVRDFVNAGTELLSKFNALNAAQKEQIVRIAAIAAAVGPVLVVIGSLVMKIGNLVSSFAKLKTLITTGTGLFAGMSAPVLAVVAAITALVGTLVYLYNTDEEFKQQVQDTITRLKDVAANIWDIVKPALESLGKSFKNLWEDLQPLIKLIGTIFVKAINYVLDLIEELTPALEPLIEFIAEIIQTIGGVIRAITALFNGDKEAFKQSIDSVGEHIKNVFKYAVEFVQKLFTGLVDWVGNIWEDIFGAGSFDSVRTTIDSFVSDIMELMSPWITFFKESIGPAIENIGLTFENVGLAIKGVIAFLKGDFEEFGNCFEKIGENMFDMQQNVITILKNFGTAWVDYWETVGEHMYDFSQKWNTYWENFGGAVYGFGQKWNEYWENFGAYMYTKISEWKRDWVSYWEERGSDLYDAVQGWKDSIKGFFSDILDKMKSLGKKWSDFWEGLGGKAYDALHGKSSSQEVTVDGSHAGGLAYVPYDGYIAELHKGERVLTASENLNYSNNTQGQGGLTKAELLDTIKQAISQSMPDGDIILQADGRQFATISRKHFNLIAAESGNLNIKV